ncbi:MAG: hypothetical protein C1943_10790 [Halochromatium sp.]|nr:hypothetical protein [Halochromatium sp.]
MFGLTMGPGMNMAEADVCLTPDGPIPVPIPYPNLQETSTTAPAAETVLFDCTPALNQSSIGLVSEGDDAGVLLGVVSHMISGEAFYIVGCTTIITDGMPQQRLTSVTGQNALGELPNIVGSCTVPSQETVLTLG